MPIDLLHFVRKWNASTLTERSAATDHFRDLCGALGVPHPTEEDEIGASYTYEKRVTKAGTGEYGFADVWKRGWFAWEYKSKGGDLRKAYKQLNEYHESLENPPLLVVCDFVRFEVHTKFQNAPPRVFAFTLDDLLVDKDTATCALPPIEVLRNVFGDYNKLRPEVVAIPVTRDAATDFLRLAQQLELERALTPVPPTKEEIAHFLMRLVFCLFADSVELLPDSTFRRLVRNHRHSPISFNRALPQLFRAMSNRDSFFGPDNIPYFNGGLFKDDRIIPLNHADLGILHSAAQHDWSHIEPAIFGTLFERSLDSAKRSMIGAHYTSPDDIALLIDPVVITPLRRRWDAVRAQAEAALAEEALALELSVASPNPGASSLAAPSSPVRVGLPARKSKASAATQAPCAPPSPTASPSAKVGFQDPRAIQPTLKLDRPALHILTSWTHELARVRILDPACGSGNFLYIALKKLLDLWQEARLFALKHALALAPEPIPSPTQLYGIEIDFYAHEIASIVVWIGFLQWKRDHGEKFDKQPLLEPLDNIQHADAILRYDEQGKPYEPEWPPADYIVGNPPFVGDKKMHQELNSELLPRYVHDLRTLYKGRVEGGADLVIFWFEKARAAIEQKRTIAAGLVATQSVRIGANRSALKRIKHSGDIFWARSDKRWMLDGAAVRISLVAFDGGQEQIRELDGQRVDSINSNLTSGNDTTSISKLPENAGLAYIGTQKGGPFEVHPELANFFLRAPLNVNGRSNSDVVKPWINGHDLSRRPRGMFVIDFDSMPAESAAQYEQPFEHVSKHVKPLRQGLRRRNHAERWWIHAEHRPGLRRVLRNLSRYIVTPRVSKYRFFAWATIVTVPDSRVVAIGRDDDLFFALLSSKTHEVWALATSSRHGVAGDITYNAESCFDTFPFPWPPGAEPTEAEDPQVHAIAEAARELVRLRDNWLNPPGASEADLKDRTLTKLYNLRAAGKATWLDNLHRTLDEAVFAAYGWPSTLTTQQILANLLALNHQRAAAQPPKPTRPQPKKPRAQAALEAGEDQQR